MKIEGCFSVLFFFLGILFIGISIGSKQPVPIIIGLISIIGSIIISLIKQKLNNE